MLHTHTPHTTHNTQSQTHSHTHSHSLTHLTLTLTYSKMRIDVEQDNHSQQHSSSSALHTHMPRIRTIPSPLIHSLTRSLAHSYTHSHTLTHMHWCWAGQILTAAHLFRRAAHARCNTCTSFSANAGCARCTRGWRVIVDEGIHTHTNTLRAYYINDTTRLWDAASARVWRHTYTYTCARAHTHTYKHTYCRV